MTREELENKLENLDIELLLADGFEDAFLGFTSDDPPKAVYDVAKMLETMVNRDGMTFDEAKEYFEYNIGCAYVGEQTPVYIRLISDFK